MGALGSVVARLVLLWVPILLSLPGCGPEPRVADRRGEVGGRAFEFQSGGADLEDGEGEFHVRLRGDALWVARVKQGRVKEYGTFRLSAKEARELWKRVDGARIPRRKSSRRRGGPDDIPYFFSLMDPKRRKTYAVEIWRDDALEDEALARLVTYVAKLIRKYTGARAEL